MKLFYRTLFLFSAICGAVGLSGCAATPAPSSTPSSAEGGSSGVTVYGSVDAGVGRRSR